MVLLTEHADLLVVARARQRRWRPRALPAIVRFDLLVFGLGLVVAVAAELLVSLFL